MSTTPVIRPAKSWCCMMWNARNDQSPKYLNYPRTIFRTVRTWWQHVVAFTSLTNQIHPTTHITQGGNGVNRWLQITMIINQSNPLTRKLFNTSSSDVTVLSSTAFFDCSDVNAASIFLLSAFVAWSTADCSWAASVYEDNISSKQTKTKILFGSSLQHTSAPD